MVRLIAVAGLVLIVASCAPSMQRSREQCRALWDNAKGLAAYVDERVKTAAADPSPQGQSQALAEAAIAESRWRAAVDVMNAGNCCAYGETCVADITAPRS